MRRLRPFLYFKNCHRTFFSEGICRKTPVARIQQSSMAGGSPHVYVLRSNKPLREVSPFLDVSRHRRRRRQ